MQHSVANFGKLLVVIGLMGFLAGSMQQWAMLAPAILGIIAVAITCGPIRTSSDNISAVAGMLVALLALFGSAGGVADIPAVMVGDPTVDGPMTLSHSLTSLVSLSFLLALAAQWLQSHGART
jgi:hypothetical protein